MDSSGILFKDRRRWFVLFVMTANFMCAVGYAFSIVPVIIPAIVRELGVSLGTAGLITTALSAAGVFLSIPAGIMLDSIGAEKSGLIALISGCVGWFLCVMSPNFNILLIGRFFLGICGIIFGATGPVLLMKWFNQGEIGKALGIWSTAIVAGRALFTPMASVITSIYGWRATLLVGFLVTLLLVLLYVLMMRMKPPPSSGPVRSSNSRISLGDLRKSLTYPQPWLFGLVILFGFFPGNVIHTYGVILLRDVKGFDEVSAGFILGLSGFSGIFGSLIAGWLSDRLGGRRKPVYLASLILDVVLVTLFVLIPSPTLSIAVLMALGLTASMKSPLNYAIPPTLATNGYVGIALGIARVFMYLPGVIVPPISGRVYEIYGLHALTLLMVVCTLSSTALLSRVKTK